MAKQCKVCTNFYPDHLPACPHCAKAAQALEDSGDEPIDVFPEDELTPDSPELAPMDPVPLFPQGAKEPPGQHIPGFHGTDLEDGGSAINLGALGAGVVPQDASSPLLSGQIEKRPESPKSGSLLTQVPITAEMTADAVDAPKAPPPASKATKIAPQTAPRTMLSPSEAMDVPGQEGAPSSSLLAQAFPDVMDVAPLSPKATMLSAPPGMKPTMLAPEEAAREATNPKATQLAPQSAQPTMLVPAGDKKTQLSAGAAPTTKLAMPDEMSALAKEGVAAPKTKMAKGASPMTKLAGADEQDKLALPEAKKTKLAQGAARMTKLAKSDEQDQLRVEPPEEEEPAYDVGSSSIDLGSAERLSATEAVEAEDIVEEEAVETEVIEPAEVEEKPVKKRGGVLLGVAGLFFGIAAALALAVLDVIPIGSLQDALGLKKKPEVVVRPGDGSDLGAAVQHLDNGDFAKAIAILDQLDKNATTHSKRGLARWLQYLQKQKTANAQLKKEDSDVELARKDFNDAGNAESKFWLGHMEEMFAGKEAAKKVYQEGADKFKDQQRMFQSAIDRLDATGDDKGPGAQLPVPLDDRFAAARFNLTVLFLPAFQANVPQDGAADEAGQDFWQAAKLAKDKDYDGAVAALLKARATHDKQRFARLRKAQNPTSDPTEEIFLRTSSELAEYWKFLGFMKSKGYNDLASAQKVLEDKDAGATLAEVIKLLKSKESKDVPADLKKALDDKEKADKQLADIKKALGNPDDVAKEAEKVIAEHKDYLKALMDAAMTLKVEKPLDVPKSVESLAAEKKMFEDKFKKADGILVAMHKQLLEAKADGVGKEPKYDEIAKGVKQMIDEAYAPVVRALASVAGSATMFGKVAGNQIGQHIDLSASLASSQTSNARYQVLLMQSRTPQQMLDVWLPLLQEARQRKDLAEKAAIDARNVQKDKQAGANLLGEARCVEGLALRNQGKYDDARTALTDALKKTGGRAGWRPYAEAGFAELTDPAAYYIPLADSLRMNNRFEDALTVLGTGLDVFKGAKSGQLLAARSLVQLDLAKMIAKGGKLSARDARVLAADKDAEAAIAAGARAEGFYAQGRVAEELANWAKAQRAYRQALASAPAADRNAGSRYRVALARVLLRIPNLPPEEKPDMKGADEKTGMLPSQGSGVRSRESSKLAVDYNPLAALFLLAAPLADDDEVPETPELDEAIRLAEEAIRAGNPEGHLVKGLALAKKGRWTEAVLEYSTGLEKLGRNPEDAKGLRFLMQNHPALKIPDGQMPADPLLAEKHYAAGLRHYWARRYEEAEREFFHAVRYHDQDARYLYFLGLARLNQGKRSFALEAFRRAGTLEQQNKPASATVSATLERIQGFDRQTLNRYRP